MEKKLDVQKYIEKLQAFADEDRPIEPGSYHGFFISGEVVLKQLDGLLRTDPPAAMACSVARLFRQH